MLKNPSKEGYCLDDGGGDTAGASKYTIRRCSTKSENQHFEVLSQATLAAEQQKVLDAVSNGAKFLLRIAAKTGMCAAGPGASIAATSLVLAACDKRSKNQIFTYDPLTKRLRSAEKLSYCLDDGGVRKTDARLASCDSSSLDQSFVYDRATLQFTQPNKAGMCLDDGSGDWFTAPKLMLRKCDAYSANQHFEYVLTSEPTTATSSVQSTATQTGLNMGTNAGTASSTAPVTTTGTTGTSGTATGPVSTELTTPATGATTAPALLQPQTEVASPVQTPAAVETTPVAAAPVASISPSVQAPPPQFSSSSEVVSTDATHPNEVIQQSPAASTIEAAPVTTATKASAAAQLTTFSEIGPTITYPAAAIQEFPTTQEPAFASTAAQNIPTHSESQTVYAQETASSPQALVEPSLTEIEGEKARLIPEENHNGVSIVTEAEPGLVPEEGHSELTTRGEHGLVSEEENNVASGESERFPEETQHGALVDSPDENFVPASKHNYVTTTDEPELIPEESHNGESMAIQSKSGFFPEEGLLKSAGEPEFFLEATMDQKSDVESAANAVPAITAVDTSFERFVDQDWNLLAPSDKTIRRVNADQSSSISADRIFQFLQSIKDRADLEHELMMYRYKRTFGCVSAGLQTLATDSVMTDEYDVLVRWMYEHCVAGSTEIALSLLPPLPKRDVNSDDVAPLHQRT
ncbi:hypothetical protein PI124_g16896 [Phytophthora idaei]|nr:hypothetical protein PI125_g16681 [Phytophthora idaei]KAG3140048.1 hypothetical protein PI126_g16198 [Phytophthora idaei]KAG3238130.1 hypothetical protein PI124_g16896 [Phytophthora idaei]